MGPAAWVVRPLVSTICLTAVAGPTRSPGGYAEPVLPYASYLRVYEPLAALSPAAREALAHDLDSAVDPAATLVSEQATVLNRTVASAAIGVDNQHTYAPYVLRLAGRSYYCPADMPLRSWLSLTSLIDSLGDANVQLLLPPESITMVDEGFLSWRRAHPEAVPHVRQTTWGVPRTWFVLVADDERELYDASGSSSIRYRARVTDARRRVARAQRVLHQVIDESDLREEMQDLACWLDEFDAASWVELDYAGVAQFLKGELDDDRSAADIHRVLTALGSADWAAAGEAYRRFESRWRVVNAHERAN